MDRTNRKVKLSLRGKEVMEELIKKERDHTTRVRILIFLFVTCVCHVLCVCRPWGGGGVGYVRALIPSPSNKHGPAVPTTPTRIPSHSFPQSLTRTQVEGCNWHPEFGAWMVESTPSRPYTGYVRAYVCERR